MAVALSIIKLMWKHGQKCHKGNAFCVTFLNNHIIYVLIVAFVLKKCPIIPKIYYNHCKLSYTLYFHMYLLWWFKFINLEQQSTK